MTAFSRGFLGVPKPARELRGAPNAWILLDTQRINNVAQVVQRLDYDELFSEYIAVLDNVVPATTAGNMFLAMSTDGGATFDTGGTSYATAVQSFRADAVANNVASATASGVRLNGLDACFNGNGGLSATIHIHRPFAAGVYKQVSYSGWYAGVTQGAVMSGGGIGVSAGLVNGLVKAVNYTNSAGNLATGDFSLYGLRR